jgi:DNA-binding beta-propeller fold protein YncE
MQEMTPTTMTQSSRRHRHYHCPLSISLAKGSGIVIVLGAVLISLVSPASADDPRLADTTVVQATQGASGSWINGPSGVAFDVPQGEIYLANTKAKTIEIFDFDLIPVAFFRHEIRNLAGEMVDGSPTAIALDRERNLLVVDMLAAFVDVVSFRGESLEHIELPAPYDDLTAGQGPGQVAVDDEGTIFVATRAKHSRVFRFSPEYELIDSWGETGAGPGSLMAVTGLAVAPDGNLVVLGKHTELAVQIFQPNGTYVAGFGGGEQGPGNFSFASGVTVTRDGRIWVSDEIRQFVDVFESDGNYVGRLGIGGRAPGQFMHPGALATDGAKVVAVAEKAGNRLQLFRIRETGTSETKEQEGSTF